MSEQQNNEIPEHLKQGWQALCDWQRARDAAKKPLPPGGEFLLNESSILSEEIGKFYRNLRVELDLPAECINIKFDQYGGKIYPDVRVNPPNRWYGKTQFKKPIPGISAEGVKEVAAVYIRSVIQAVWTACMNSHKHRVFFVHQIRPDLEPQVIEDLFAEE